MDEEPPLEGFICPICIKNFDNPNLLTKHFDDSHNDAVGLKTFKDFIGKAKKKILKKGDADLNDSNVLSPSSEDIDWGPQELGQLKSHTSYFKEERNIRLERYSAETNKLIIRIDKLMNKLPNDPIQRKAHERSIVPWMDDNDVKICLTCAKSFNIARRKHHCRLCGVMMCHDCSMFLSLTEARNITSPTLAQTDSALSPTTETLKFSDRLVQAGVSLTKLAQTPSSNNLNNVLSIISDSSNKDQYFRVCQYCKNLLDAREKLKARHYNKPVVHQYYDKLHSQILLADNRIEQYYKMWNSIRNGESIYNLRDAQELRGEIAKLGDCIDIASKRIANLIAISEDSTPILKQEFRLNQMIRTKAMIFLKNEILRIPPLPSEEEYIALKKDYEEKIRQKYENDKLLEDNQKQRNELRNSYSSSSMQMVMDQSQGWGTSGPPAGNMMISSEKVDPFIEQMRNLKFYIKQAREECKFEEAALLEKNLKELQSDYFSRQQSDNID